MNNTSTGGGGAPGFTRKRSLHASSGRPVYEQVDEIEESGSGSLALVAEKQMSQGSVRLTSPSYNQHHSSAHGAKSAKVKRKGIPKTNIDTNLPKSSEKM